MPSPFRLILAALAALAAASPVAAQSGDRIAAAFAEADVDGDGYVDVDEYVGYFIRAFRNVDADGDGSVIPADLDEVDPEAFAAADRDADGAVSLGEAIAERMILFFRIDANGDGVLTLDEVRSHTPS